MRKVMTAAFCIALAAGAAQAKELLNLDKTGLALQGYDPVAFFADGKAVKGRPDISAVHEGARYLFASTAHKDEFVQNPGHYTPAYGGFCAYAVSQGHTASVEIDTWQIFQGRLMLNYSQKVKGLFDADRTGYTAKADVNWPGIVEEMGK